MCSKIYNWIILFTILFVISCRPSSEVYEQTVSFKGFEWDKTNQQDFTFTLSDTASSYNVYLVFRHLYAYDYNNLLLDIKSDSSGSSPKTLKYNFKIGEKDQWHGKKLSGIIAHRIKLNDLPLKFSRKNLNFTITHRMPGQRLSHVLNVGLRIQKI